jgi:hypothetical protein
MFLSATEPKQVRTVVTQFAGSLESTILDLEKRKGKVNPPVTQSAYTRASTYSNYSEYIEGHSNERVFNNQSVAVKTVLENETKYVAKYDLRSLETKYEVGGKEYTFEEICENINEIAQFAPGEIKMVDAKPSLKCCTVLNQEDIEEKVLSGESARIFMGVPSTKIYESIQKCTFEGTANTIKSTMMKDEPVLDIEVSDTTIRIPLVTSVYHKGVDRHDMLPNGALKPVMFQSVDLDSTLSDRIQYQKFLEDISTDKAQYTYFNYSWFHEAANQPKFKDYISQWFPCVVPGTDNFVLSRMKGKHILWQNSHAMKGLMNMIKKIHFLVSFVSYVGKKTCNEYLKLLCTRLECEPEMRDLIRYSFKLYTKNVQQEVSVTRSQLAIYDRIVDLA